VEPTSIIWKKWPEGYSRRVLLDLAQGARFILNLPVNHEKDIRG